MYQVDGRSFKGAPLCKRGHVKVIGQRDCSECRKIRKAAYDERNPDGYKKWYEANKDWAGQTRRKAWFDRQSDETKQRIRREAFEKLQQWKLDNPDKYAENRRRAKQVRKARERTSGRIKPKDFDAVKERQKHACFDCGRCDVRLTIGHLVPVSKGGTNILSNIVAQCMSCNRKQAAKIHPTLLERDSKEMFVQNG